MVLKVMAAGVFLVSVICSLSLFVQNFTLTADYERKISEQTTEIKNLHEDLSGLETKLNQQQEFLDSRQGFLDSVAKAKAALLEAEKTTDVTDSMKTINEAQEIVYHERGTVGNITIQTERVNKETGRLLTRVGFLKKDSSLTPEQTVTAADLAEDVEGLRTLPADHPARKALDAVGGANILLGAAPVVCGFDNSLACAYPSGVILLAEEFTNEDYDYYYGVMMHEYAHQIQFKYREDLEYSEQYDVLFGKDIEWLADCMAAAKIPGYSSNYQYKCSASQVTYGAKAWQGVFQ
jgi:hypothetical protein